MKLSFCRNFIAGRVSKAFGVFVVLFTALTLLSPPVIAAKKDKLLIGMAGQPTTMDPGVRLGLPMLQTWPLVFDGILSRDPKGKIGPGLASSYKFVKPTVIELKIRKGVKFHNGESADAHAVKYSIDRLFDPKLKSRVKTFFRSVKKVVVIDSHTVQIHTKTPDRYLLSPLADFGYVVPPKHYKATKLKVLARKPIGSGPYRLTKWKKGSEMVFEASKGYWNPSKQKVKKVVIKHIPENTTRASALISGYVDMIKDIPPQLVSMVSSKSNLDVVQGPGPKACSLIMVLKKGAPWTNVKVRQAVNYAINKKSIIKNVMMGYATLAKGTVVGPDSFGHNPNIDAYHYNLEKAKKLMKEAGFEKGFEVPLMVPQGRYLKGQAGAEAIAGNLKKLNIKVKVTPLEYAAWRRNSRSKWEKHRKPYWNYACRNDIALHSAWMFGGLLFSKSTHGGVRSDALDKMIKDAAAESNEAKQISMYQKLNKHIRNNAYLVFLYHLDEISGKRKEVDWKMRNTGLVIASDAGWK